MADVKKIRLGETSYDIKDVTARAGLEEKQDKLTAGTGITIDEDNVISATAEFPKYLSVERLDNYIFKATFDSIPEYDPTVTSPVDGGCSSFVRGGKLYRNYDWKYDNTAEFMVICKDFQGMASILGMNDGSLDAKKIAQLPYHLVDGVNKSGIKVSTHILYNDWSYAGAGDKDQDIMLLPYYILSNLHSISDINTVLGNYVANIKIPEILANAEYLLQFVVTDGETTYCIMPPASSTGSYVIQNITSNPKLTNFRWVADETVVRANLQRRPTGVERWNEVATSELEDLRFTKCYEEPTRLSEFIGIDETTKDSTDAELTVIYNEAHAAYQTRTRDGVLWQTVHSVVYGADSMEHLWCQEKFDKDYVATGEFPIEPNVVYGVNSAEEQIAYHAGNLIEFEDGTLGDGLYRRLEYIETHNDAYIDTGIIADLSSEIYCKYALNTWQTMAANPQIVFGTVVSPNVTGFQVRTFSGQRSLVVSAESSGAPTTQTYYTSLDTNVSEAHLLNGRFTDGEFAAALFPPFMAGQLNQSLRIMGTGDDTSLSDGKIYGFYAKLYTGADYAINLIPAKRISDNKVGMYDTVSGDFFTSETDTDFIAGPLATPVISTEIKSGVGIKVEGGVINVDTDLLQSKLTAGENITITESMVGVGYKGLEKINTGAYSSSNLPYIDLGFKFLPDQHKIEVGFDSFRSFAGLNKPYIATGSIESDKMGFFIGVVEGANPGSNDLGFYFDKQSTPVPYKQNSFPDDKVDIVIDYDQKIKVNGTTVYTKTDTSREETEGTVRLFGLDSQSCINLGSIRYFRLSYHGTLTMDLRPAKRVTDGVVGLYDVLQKKFYTSSNIYQFGAGPELTSTISSTGGSNYTAGTGIDITDNEISAVKGEWEWAGDGKNSVELGNSALADGTHAVAVGNNARISSDSQYGVAIGNSATIYGNYNMSIGPQSHVGSSTKQPSSSIAIGFGAGTDYNYNVVIGQAAQGRGTENVAIGHQAGYLSADSGSNNITIGYNTYSAGVYSVAIGGSSYANATRAVVIGSSAFSLGNDGIAIGAGAHVYGDGAFQIGLGENYVNNSLNFRSYQLVDANGYIPHVRLASNGTVGQVLTLASSGTMQWKTVDALPTQIGQSGKFLTTNGTAASWTEIPRPTYNATTKTISF